MPLSGRKGGEEVTDRTSLEKESEENLPEGRKGGRDF